MCLKFEIYFPKKNVVLRISFVRKYYCVVIEERWFIAC